jgi:hypothetical protein
VAEEVEAVKAGKLLFDHGSVLAKEDVRTIGTAICMGNRQSLIAKRTEHSTIGS